MGVASYQRSNFLGGEWSKTAQGRADHPDYVKALNVCSNALPIEAAAWVRRPGTRHLGPTRGGKPGRVLPFDFKQSFPYTPEFTDGFLRFWAGPNLVMVNATHAVVNISTAKPAVVSVSSHGMVTGNSFRFGNLGTSCPTLQNRTFVATVINTNTFSMSDSITGAPIDGSTLGAFQAGATIQQVYELTTPYTSGSWANLRSVQAETTSVFLNGASPWALSVVTPPSSAAFATFSLTQLGNRAVLQGLSDGPYLDENGSTLLIQNQLSGQVTINSGSYPDSRQTGFAPGDKGRAIRVRLRPPPWQSDVNYAINQLVTFVNGNTTTFWSCVTQDTAVQPGINLDWAAVDVTQAAQWAPGVILSVVNNSTVAIGISTTFDYFVNNATIYEWQLGAYSDAVGWPTCGCYHEGRLWLAGAIDNRIDASVSNDIFNFAPTDTTGTISDSNAITAVFNAKDVNSIFWMESNSLGIICGTQAGEWLVQATAQNLPLTPSSIQAHRVTRIGCANIEPRETGNSMVFVQRYQRSLIEYFPDVFSGRLTAPNLSEQAKHLTLNNLAEIAYQQELSPVIWARDGVGALLGASYKRESLMSSQGPTFIGWHRHTLGSGRTVQSICTGASEGGNLDALFMVTNDAANIHHVEMLTDLFEETDTLASAWFLDDAITPSSTTTTDTVSAGFPYGGLTLNGLWHLNGKTVQVFANGLDLGQQTPGAATFTDFVVSNGSVTIPYADGLSQGPGAGQFVNTFATGATIVVGFTYTSQGQCTRPSHPAETGARSGPGFGKIRRSAEYAIQVVNSAGLSIGTDFTKLYPILFKNNVGQIMPAGQTYTGIYWDKLNDDYSFDSMLCWQISRPLPAIVAAIGAYPHTQDR